MPVKLEGWGDVEKVLNGLSAKVNAATKTSLMQVGLAAEADAKATIRDQSENWTPLSDKYLKRKTSNSKNRKRYSEKILIRTSSYFQSITSWFGNDKVFVGVPANAKNSETGVSIAEYAKVLEYGSVSKNIPPRPLWSAVLNRAKKRVLQIFSKNFKQLL